MGRDIQWREAVVRLLVAARPMTMAARVAGGESALRALAAWGNEAWQDDESAAQGIRRPESVHERETALSVNREIALERVTPIALVGRRPMSVRASVGGSPMARRPRETATWRERWPDVPAVRGTRGAAAR